MKKIKLIVLSLILLVSIKSISQTVTERTPYPVLIQENNVIIDTSVAHLIANDLAKGDECIEEIKLVKENLKLSQKEVSLKDSILVTKDKQIDGFKLIVSKKTEMFTKQEEISNTYKTQLLKQESVSLFFKILSFIGIASTGYFILKH